MPQTPLRQRTPRPGSTPLAKPAWDTCAERFLMDCRARDLSPSTLAVYRISLLGPCTNTFRKDHGVTRPSEFTGDLLRQFQVELQEAGRQPGTVRGYHKVIKTFARYCEAEGLDVDPSLLRVKVPSTGGTKKPETYTDEEVKRLMAAAVCPRDRVIIELFYRTGLRRQELTSLRLSDIVISPEGSYLFVRNGKGRKQRMVPLDTKTHKMSKVLANYIARVRPQTEDDHLFMNRLGKPLSPLGLQHTLRRLGERVGIHCHAHAFRHTYATNALKAGVPLAMLQRALGHSTITMTSHYLQFQTGDLIREWLKLAA